MQDELILVRNKYLNLGKRRRQRLEEDRTAQDAQEEDQGVVDIY